MILGWDHLEDSGRQGGGIPLAEDYAQRREEMELDRLEVERIREIGRQLALGNRDFDVQYDEAIALMSEWENENSKEESENE